MKPYTEAEFFEAAKKRFVKYYGELDPADVDRFLKEEEPIIKRRYQDYLEDLKDGELTVEQFNIGCVASVGYYLYMSY